MFRYLRAECTPEQASCYSVEMFTSIVQVEALASEQMAYRLTWGQYVNWNGGQGKNVACDMVQEICNRVSKDVVKGMGANKMEKAMIRASKAAAGVFQIVRAMNGSLQIHDVPNTHSKRSLCEDEMLMLDDLRKLSHFREHQVDTIIIFLELMCQQQVLLM